MHFHMHMDKERLLPQDSSGTKPKRAPKPKIAPGKEEDPHVNYREKIGKGSDSTNTILGMYGGSK